MKRGRKGRDLRILTVITLAACLLLTMISREHIINTLSFNVKDKTSLSLFQITFYNNSSQHSSIYASPFSNRNVNITHISTSNKPISNPSVLKTFSSTTTWIIQAETIQKTQSICATFSMRLGNNMFQFASAYGIAKSRNMSLIVDSDALVRQLFKIDKNISTDIGPCRSAYTITERWSSAFDDKLLKFDNKHDYKIKTYLQSWKYFKHVEDDIRRQFNFNENISASATKIINRLIQKHRTSRSNVTLVGIHVRRGDYVSSKTRLIATKEYLERAIKYYRSKFKNILFILCSDDIKWCKENLRKQNTLEFIEKNPSEIDLAILAQCDHVIQTVGSYSWWAAWLAGGTSIFYKWPARNGTGYREKYSEDYTDYFYPGWIGM